MDIVKHVYGTTAEWAANDIILSQGELGVEKTTDGEHKTKIGDGTHAWSALPYTGITPTQLSGLATKVAGGTTGHLVKLDANGNIEDSGKGISDFEAADEAIMKTDEDQTMTADLTLKGSPTTDHMAADKLYVDTTVAGLSNARHYTARWNKSAATMTRLNDAAKITTTITNFAHRGSVNANYENPFDSIYPWSGRKLCNIDITRYRALTAGHSITECVKAWEGDTDFSYADTNGVWVYTPEFWGKSWDDGTYRYFDVADKATGGHVHYPESIEGRWHGRTATITIGDTAKTCLVPTVGMPAKSIAMSTLHTYAKNWGATLDSIFSIDASSLLMIVEFATMNSQSAIGEGVDNMYRQSSDLIAADATASTVVKVVKSAAQAYCIPGAIFDIGTTNGGANVGSYLVVSVETDAGDNTLLDVTLDAAVTVTTAHYWSVHGLGNVADEDIGSKSGYIGTNGKCSAYYRGEVLFGNMFFYILGAYRQTGTQHVFIANNEEEADAVDALNAAVHYDTGITLASSGGYVNTLGQLTRSGLLAVPPFCTAVGGSSSAPVGDYHYIDTSAGNAVLIRGGYAIGGSGDGAFYGSWSVSAAYSGWIFAARPRLKTP